MRAMPIASWALALASVAVLLSNCQQAVPAAPGAAGVYAADDVAEMLPGTWLREQRDGDTQVRRLLVLGADGRFTELVRISDGRGEGRLLQHAGTWIYDGTNLKRHYSVMNGRPASRLVDPFATFEIQFGSRNEFTGVDHVHRVRVRYERVAADTVP